MAARLLVQRLLRRLFLLRWGRRGVLGLRLVAVLLALLLPVLTASLQPAAAVAAVLPVCRLHRFVKLTRQK